jgi:hypothetical protein
MKEPSLLQKARRTYHATLLESGTLRLTTKKDKAGNPVGTPYPTNADADSPTSVAIATAILKLIEEESKVGERLKGQISGSKFEQITKSFVTSTFSRLSALRPGNWDLSPKKRSITRFDQYHHLADIQAVAENNPEIAAVLGREYVIAPDIVLVRMPEPDETINSNEFLVDDTIATRSSLRKSVNNRPILHASISCKWTLRSDRAQNARSEALNLVRNRKGRLPHVIVVTGEPLPSRLASLALGTGDIDCVYHFALPELMSAVAGMGDTYDLVKIMVEGKRLKDISDLPLDLAV